eukprot:TRINITY_DN20403_c0_g1_i1.p1 TRINITY_DN20403_c0_g1~~TRINITY_DN20403_c0_g1_i1.p1  ORF type:complete len:439 (-),score=109.36 TRINITY_DN20403_c0_g1_i1:254-1570(-)
MEWDSLELVNPVLPEAAEPYLIPVPAAAVKVLPRWAEEDEVKRWRLKYRPHEDGEANQTHVAGNVEDGKLWLEVELRPFTRELPLTGLEHGRLHYFKVAIETPDGWSNWSHIVSCLPPSPELPGKPAAVYGIVKDDTTVLVRWTRPIDFAAAVSCGSVLRYKLLIKWQPFEGEDPTLCSREIIIEEDADCCEVTDLQCLRDYTFQVAAENVSGWGEFSDCHGEVINVPCPVPPQLPPPTLRRATHHTVVIQWQHPPLSDVPVESFNFRYSASGDFESKDVQMVTGVAPNISQFIIQGLNPGTNYTFQVAAVNRYGMGIWSESSLSTKTLEGTTPSKIAGLTVPNEYKSFITLDWEPASENGFPVTKHLIRFSYREDLSDPIELEPTVTRHQGHDRADIRHLQKKCYFFQVACFNVKGMSEWSDAVKVDLEEKPRLLPN